MNDYEVIASATTLLAAGWCQNGFRTQPDATGARSYCIDGALLTTVGATSYFDETAESARKHVVAALPAPYRSPITFNDAPGRTQADVLAVMGRALEAVRQTELATESELVSV